MTRAKLLIPGPVDIPDEICEAMAIPPMPHYGQAWKALYHETQEMARQVFKTRNDIFIMTGPGTMALEAGAASALEPGTPVLMPVNGFFGDRLATVLESLQLEVIRMEIPWGEPIRAENVVAAMESHPEAMALAIVHHETSTSVLNPLEEILDAVRDHELLTIVDAVSSLGGVPVLVDAWGIDLCVTVANKTLETPPGLSLISISPRAWEWIEQRQAPRGWYLDLKTWRWYAENWGSWHPTPTTMPTSNVNALHESLKLLLAEGIEERFAAYRAAAEAVRQGLTELGFPMLIPDGPWASPLTTAFLMRPGVDAEALQRSLLAESGVMISGGLGPLHGKILRVGHIGLARRSDYIQAFLEGVERYLKTL